MYEMNFSTPLDVFGAVRAKIMNTWFKSDNPTLTRFTAEKRYAKCLFKSEYSEDIDLVEEIVAEFCPFYDYPTYEIVWIPESEV